MKWKFAGVLLIAGLASFSRAQAPPADTEAMTQTDSSDAEPATEPALDESAPPPPQATGVPPTTQMTRSTTRPSRRRRRRTPIQAAGQSPLVSPTPQPGKMSADFDAVMNRSIFLKGAQTQSHDGGASSAAVGSASAPERSLVFNGVTRGDSAMAMVENIETHEILKLHVGDPISRGSVVAITLDNLDYEAGGVVTRVGFGQNLSGGTTAGENTAALPGAPGTTQPSNSSVTRQLGESVEAYLRRRHAMGL